MNDNYNKNNKNESDVISWIITALCLWLWPPLGVVFLISKLSKNDFLKKSISKMLDKSSVRRGGDYRYGPGPGSQWGDFPGWGQSRTRNAGSGEAPAGPQYGGAAQAQAEAPAWRQAPAWGGPGYASRQTGPRRSGPEAEKRGPRSGSQPEKTEKPSDGIDRVSKGKGALLVFGWILFALGIFQLFDVFSSAFGIWQAIQWGAVAAGGGAMLLASARKSKKEKEYDKYVKIVGGKAYIEVEKIALSVGAKQKEVLRELDDMVERGYFGKAAYIDMASGLLIIDPEAAEAELKTKAAPSRPADSASAPKDKYELLLSELRHACLRVRSASMREKTDKIEALTEQIFAYVRETPEKEGSISGFINYYLPTTLKLINAYADFEAQEFQGQNIIKSRERIEAACDTIIKAYERQLDNLYLMETIDVSSDISVLENMLKRDGLDGKNDFGSSMPSS